MKTLCDANLLVALAPPPVRVLADDLPYGEADMTGVIGHRQVTDAYLAGLARARKGSLATFDRGLVALHHDVALLVSI